MSRVVLATAYGGPGVLAVVDVEPPAPGPGQVLLRVHAAGVNPADWKSYTGVWGTDPDRLPLRVGFEAAGTVLAVGPDVQDVSPGDEVLAQPVSGAYAEHLVVPAAVTLPRPATVPWPEAAGLLVAGTTAVHTLTAADVRAGETVLVHGASGAVGAMVVQLARYRGARVVGTAAPDGQEYVRSLGAEPVPYGPGLEDRVRRLAPHVDAAVDTAGTREALDVSVVLVPDRTRVVTIAGFDHGARLGVRLLGNGPGAEPGTAVRAAARPELVRLAAQGLVRVRIGSTHDLAEAADVHRAAMAGRTRGKSVLLP